MLKRLLLRTASWLASIAGADLAPVSVPIPPTVTVEPYRPRVSTAALEAARRTPPGSAERAAAFRQMFPLPEPPKGFQAAGGIVMDAAIDDLYANADFAYLGEGIGFLGFPYLSELSQRPEYRVITEIRAEEMTRKGIEISYAADEGDDPSDGANKAKELEDAWAQFHCIEVLRKCVEHDGFFGRGQIYIDLGNGDKPDELRTRLIVDERKIPKGKLRGFTNIEPIWTYPNEYNASNPLNPTFFKPQNWYVQGTLVHESRLLTVVGREMPDILKPAYAFAGLSLSQMAKPYVDNWLRTRQSISDLIHSFSVMVLLTDMGAVIQDGGSGDDLFKRLDIFNATRDNRGIFALDKNAEDFKNVSAPVSGLHELQAQSQEQMASVTRTPLVKLLGITPSGLNASSDGEIRVFYDSIAAWQEKMLMHPVRVMLDVLQLHLWGKIDPKITFRFLPLWELDEAAQSATNKSDADTDAVYIEAGVLHPEEVRRTLAIKREGRYAGIDVADVPEPPDMGEGDLGEPGDGDNPAKSAEPRKVEMSGDAQPQFKEADHPRDPDGKLTSGGGGGGGSSSKGGGELRVNDPDAPGAQPAKVPKAARSVDTTSAYVPAAKFGRTGGEKYYAKTRDPDVTPAKVLSKFDPSTVEHMLAVADKVRHLPQTQTLYKKDGQYTPERRREHAKIVGEILSREAVKAATPAPGEKPTFTLLGGRGGSGKSSMKGLVYAPGMAIVLDNDEIKKMLPEYAGWNAGLLHEEASDIFDAITAQAQKMGLNLVHDATMKTPDKAVKMVDNFLDAGYRIEAHYMHAAPQVAAERAVKRGMSQGRVVLPEVVLANTENEKAFDLVKSKADRWSFFDNNGDETKLISSNFEV